MTHLKNSAIRCKRDKAAEKHFGEYAQRSTFLTRPALVNGQFDREVRAAKEAARG